MVLTSVPSFQLNLQLHIKVMFICAFVNLASQDRRYRASHVEVEVAVGSAPVIQCRGRNNGHSISWFKDGHRLSRGMLRSSSNKICKILSSSFLYFQAILIIHFIDSKKILFFVYFLHFFGLFVQQGNPNNINI